MMTPIEDYAVIGDGRTCALISRNGSLDWLSLPDLDSPASFASLLGRPEHGQWLLTVADGQVTSRRYKKATFVVVTEYVSPTGTARVTECMPLNGDRNDIIRRVDCLSGEIRVHHELRVRFGYGKIVPWASRAKDEAGVETLRFVAGPDSLTLHAAHLPHGHDKCHEGVVSLTAGERADFTLTWTKSWEPIPAQVHIDDAIADTKATWRRWFETGDYSDGYGLAVRRSLLVLRLLTNKETGGIAAAATTSLPETFGGVRNWDYRFCWLRDSALTLIALLEYGFRTEAHDWRNWLLRAVAGDPEDLQIMYRIDGGRILHEYDLEHLPGYAGSRPVRIGNAAAGQVQHDVLGEVMAALAFARDRGIRETEESWSLQVHLVNNMIGIWREPDHGIWEVRGPKQHFTQSKVMCWVALDRAIQAIDQHGLTGPRERWVTIREEIRDDVLTHGLDPSRQHFVQHYRTTEVDASLLNLAQVGFLPASDERFINTVHRVKADLSDGAHVLRYRTETGVDGLPDKEHHFYACSFWLVDALARIGEVDAAEQRFETLLATSNELGVFAEEYDVTAERFAGNYPQALSHLALVRAAHTLRNVSRVGTDA